MVLSTEFFLPVFKWACPKSPASWRYLPGYPNPGMYIFVYFLHTTAGGESPDQLMQVMLPLIDNDICNQPDWYDGNVDDSMVCAGYQEGRLGNCHVSSLSIPVLTSTSLQLNHMNTGRGKKTLLRKINYCYSGPELFCQIFWQCFRDSLPSVILVFLHLLQNV